MSGNNIPRDFEQYKFARETLSKEVEYRREKQWKIFSWTNSILLGITGGLIAISGKDFLLRLYQKFILLGAIIVLTAYSCIWINENWRKANNAKDKMVEYDGRFNFDLTYASPKRVLGFGYIPTIILLALAAAITVFFIPHQPAPNISTQQAREGALVTPPTTSSSGDVRTGYIFGNTFEVKEIKYSAVNGYAIFEGDIVLGTVEKLDAIAQWVNAERSKPKPPGLIYSPPFGLLASRRWPNAIVHYEIAVDLPNKERITDAINHWQQNTRIRFIDVATLPSPVTSVLNIPRVKFQRGNECSSGIGFLGQGVQYITLSDRCGVGEVIHEIGHTVGLWHEQSRGDRNLHIRIDFNNIRLEKRHNFDQHIVDGDDIGPYDHGSIMHYPAFINEFAIDPSRPVITTIPPGIPIGQRTGLSPGDIMAVRTMYP